MNCLVDMTKWKSENFPVSRNFFRDGSKSIIDELVKEAFFLVYFKHILIEGLSLFYRKGAIVFNEEFAYFQVVLYSLE